MLKTTIKLFSVLLLCFASAVPAEPFPSGFFFDIQRGRVPGYTGFFKSGHNEAVSTASETLWSEGGLYAYIPTATVVTLSSSSTADTAAGAGCGVARVLGQTASYVEVTELVTLNGQSGVSTTNSYLRIYELACETPGTASTTDVNTGIIYAGTGTITTGKPANVYGLVDAGHGKSLMCMYTIPAGWTGYLVNFATETSAGKDIDVVLLAREEGGAWQTEYHGHLFQSPMSIDTELPIIFTEKTDIEFRATAASAGGAISCSMQMVLGNNIAISRGL